MYTHVRRFPFHLLAWMGATALLVLAIGCAQPEAELIVEPDFLYFEPIGQGQDASFADTTEVVIRDSLAWAQLQQSLRPLAPFKPVDFSQAMVALVAIPVTSGGYSIEVESVQQDDQGAIEVNYLFTRPDADCITVTSLAVPFQAVLVRRAEGSVRFVSRSERFQCTF